MSFRTKRVIFSTPFYMLFQFFLFKYLFLFFGGLDDVYLIILSVFIGFIRIVPMFFEARKSRSITRFLAKVDGIWMWASVMLLIDIVILYLIASFYKLPLEVISLSLVIILILGIYNYYNAYNLVVNEKVLKIKDLNQEINIAHLSDVHFGSVRHDEIIEKIAFKLRQLEDTCKLAIISGDLADGSSVIKEDDFMALSNVDMPIIFTPGNHDFYMGIDNVIKACKKAGVIVLDNSSFKFENLNIYGLTFSFEDREMPEIKKDIIDSDALNILNYHVPYYWEEFSDLGFDIQLSGHTHGGQFYPAVFFSNLIFKYNKGLFKNEYGKYLNVTTGVGCMDISMRWGTKSEINVLKLKKF